MTGRLGPRVPATGPRWTPRRKAEVIREFARADETTRAALMAKHNLTTEELNSWRQGYRREGLNGLAARRQGAS
jgi:transposase-like protein